MRGISTPVLAILTVVVFVAIGALILMGIIPIGQQASKNVVLEVTGTPVIYTTSNNHTVAVVTVRNLGSDDIKVSQLIIKDGNGAEYTLTPVEAGGSAVSGEVTVGRGQYTTIKFDISSKANLTNLVNVAGVIITDKGNIPVNLVVTESW